ncbi:UNVERIFIED_CONTAM: hypothetical protein FKN15_024729 [Acipenser sinensis]
MQLFTRRWPILEDAIQTTRLVDPDLASRGSDQWSADALGRPSAWWIQILQAVAQISGVQMHMGFNENEGNGELQDDPCKGVAVTLLVEHTE